MYVPYAPQDVVLFTGRKPECRAKLSSSAAVRGLSSKEKGARGGECTNCTPYSVQLSDRTSHFPVRDLDDQQDRPSQGQTPNILGIRPRMTSVSSRF